MKRPDKKLGFSLLEILLILVVIAGIFIASFNRYETYLKEKDFEIVKGNVAKLFQQLDLYYSKLWLADPFDQCNPVDNPLDDDKKVECVSNNKLNEKNLWPTDLIASKLVDKGSDSKVSAYQVSATSLPLPSQCPSYSHKLNVIAKLNIPPTELSWYANRLGATVYSTDNYQIMWQQSPSQSITKYSGSDPLWLLSGNLESFKKTQLTQVERCLTNTSIFLDFLPSSDPKYFFSINSYYDFTFGNKKYTHSDMNLLAPKHKTYLTKSDTDSPTTINIKCIDRSDSKVERPLCSFTSTLKGKYRKFTITANSYLFGYGIGIICDFEERNEFGEYKKQPQQKTLTSLCAGNA